MSEQQQPARQFLVQRIYTKDISFESPATPQIFQENWKPEIKINLNTEHKSFSEGLMELVLTVSVDAKHDAKTVFLVEVKHAGLFTVTGFNEEEQESLMGIAGPNILFPYAREVVTDLVTRGGFPQLVLQPVNFEAMFARTRQEKSDRAAAGQGEALN